MVRKTCVKRPLYEVREMSLGLGAPREDAHACSRSGVNSLKPCIACFEFRIWWYSNAVDGEGFASLKYALITITDQAKHCYRAWRLPSSWRIRPLNLSHWWLLISAFIQNLCGTMKALITETSVAYSRWSQQNHAAWSVVTSLQTDPTQHTATLSFVWCPMGGHVSLLESQSRESRSCFSGGQAEGPRDSASWHQKREQAIREDYSQCAFGRSGATFLFRFIT